MVVSPETHEFLILIWGNLLFVACAFILILTLKNNSFPFISLKELGHIFYRISHILNFINYRVLMYFILCIFYKLIIRSRGLIKFGFKFLAGIFQRWYSI